MGLSRERHARAGEALEAEGAAADGRAEGAGAARAEEAAEAATLAGAWPPAGATPIDVEDLYDRLAEFGFDYGPLFQGLRAAWREGERIFAEVALPAESENEAARFALHPALLDAALHTAALSLLAKIDAGETEGMQAHLPFSWTGVALSATGASALRVWLTPGSQDGSEGLSLLARTRTARRWSRCARS